MTTRLAVIALVMLVGAATPHLALADQPCEVVPMPCTFEGRPFRVRVVDADTRAPIEGVHVLAEWKVKGGPLTVQDAVTGPDGVAAFPGWGPKSGPYTGMQPPVDPGLTFFKPGYLTREIFNERSPLSGYKDRVRRFHEDGDAFEMWPFSGTPERWAMELAKATRTLSAPMSDEVRRSFREPYLRRLYRVRAERDALPEPVRSDQKYFGLLEGHLWTLETK